MYAVWSYKDRIQQSGQTSDKTEWGITPPTINASYSPVEMRSLFLQAFYNFLFMILMRMMPLTMAVSVL